jgi:hypothetical protein
MSHSQLFKVLIFVNWTLQLLMYVLPVFSWYSDPMIEKLMALDGYGAALRFTDSIFYKIPLWGFFVASVGMFFFKNWARYLYLIFWFYGWVATLLFGFRVSEPIQGFMGMAVGTIDGMVLYLVFLSVLRFEFKKASPSL